MMAEDKLFGKVLSRRTWSVEEVLQSTKIESRSLDGELSRIPDRIFEDIQAV